MRLPGNRSSSGSGEWNGTMVTFQVSPKVILPVEIETHQCRQVGGSVYIKPPAALLSSSSRTWLELARLCSGPTIQSRSFDLAHSQVRT